MFNHVPSLHIPTPTLLELYTEDSSIFDELELPEDLDPEAVSSYIMLKLGSLETIFHTAEEAKAGFTLWSKVHSGPWEKIWTALQEEYRPLENYAMLETMTDDETVKEYGKTSNISHNMSHNKTGTEEVQPDITEIDAPNETSASGVYGFNSQQAVPDSTETTTGNSSRTTSGSTTTVYNTHDSDSGTDSTTDSGSDTETRNYTLTRSGNIGVTTSQQMLESEIEIRCKWNMYEIISASFRHEFCVAVW